MNYKCDIENMILFDDIRLNDLELPRKMTFYSECIRQNHLYTKFSR